MQVRLKTERTSIILSVFQKFIKKKTSLNFLSLISLSQATFGLVILQVQRAEKIISHGSQRSRAFRMFSRMRLMRFLMIIMILIHFLIVWMVNIHLCFARYLAEICRLSPLLSWTRFLGSLRFSIRK